MTHDEKIVEALSAFDRLLSYGSRSHHDEGLKSPNGTLFRFDDRAAFFLSDIDRDAIRAAITAYQAEAAKAAETLDEADPAGRIAAATETKAARDDWWDKPGEGLSEDPEAAFNQVKSFALSKEFIRTRDLQRHFQIGFNRAASYAERMEDAGLVSKWDAEIEGRYVLNPSPIPRLHHE